MSGVHSPKAIIYFILRRLMFVCLFLLILLVPNKIQDTFPKLDGGRCLYVIFKAIRVCVL